MSLSHNPTQPYRERKKRMKRLQITLDDEIHQWVTKEIKRMRFGSYSHAINYAMKRLKEESEKESK